ncbi:OmpP1/FadL family transporter [Helicobacter anatolicus]|uniref:OmpP1/FadL family transporter n=1 Tax=Helicobacter anatolicus TaxID=2905874 RepID=UPI003D80A887
MKPRIYLPKKISFYFLLFFHISYAGGFKVQEQSLNGTALNSAYVAGARGADASYYNPANMGFSNDWGENKSEFELATSLLQIPGFDFQVPTTNQGLYSQTNIKYHDTSKKCDWWNLVCLGALGAVNAFAPKQVDIEHSKPDSQIVNGSTGTTNFILPKFFYKSRTKSGFTFGASFVASSGLAMQWKDKGGEFLQDVFIMMVEFSPSLSYTIKDRFSIGIGPRIMYAMGSFNNVVYVPMQWKNGQKPSGTSPTCTDPKNSCIALTGADLDAIGIDNIPSELMNESAKDALKAVIKLGIFNNLDDIVDTSTTTMHGTTKVYQKSEGKDLSAGYRISASLRVFDNGMFSVVYNSSVPFNMQGTLEATSYVGGAMGNVLTKTNLNIAVNMPEILTLSYAHDFFNHRLRVEGVYERTFWAKGPNFLVTPDFENAEYIGLSGMVKHFTSEKLKSMVGLADFSGVSNMGAGWRDTNTFRLGITYQEKNFRLMGSVAYDEAPSPQDKIGIPDSNGYMFALGGKYKFRDFVLGLAYSLTIKDNRTSLYQQAANLGQFRILTASLEYHW